jgi:hypothetical protein
VSKKPEPLKVWVRKGNASNRGPCMGCLKRRGRVWRVMTELRYDTASRTMAELRLCADCARKLAQELPRYD